MSQFIVKPETVLDDMQTIGNWTAGSGSIAADTANFLSGSTQGIQITPVAAGAGYMTKTISIDMTVPETVSLYVYFPTLTGVTDLVLYLSNDSGFTNFYSVSINPTGALYGCTTGWNKITIPRRRWSATGSPAWTTTMVRCRVRIDASAGQPTVTIGNVTYGGYNKPKIIMGFDDGFATQYSEAYPYMKKYGMRGTAYLIAGAVVGLYGGSYMTKAQIQEMYDYGWDIGNHTYNHLHASGLSLAAQTGEFKSCQDYIIAQGWTRNEGFRHGAYPYGDFDTNSPLALASLQPPMLTYRTLTERAQQVIDQNGGYLIKVHNISNVITLATMKGWVDDAIDMGATVELLIHEIVTSSSTGTQMNTSDFEALIDYIAQRKAGGLLDVITRPEWYKGLSQGQQRKNIDSNQ